MGLRRRRSAFAQNPQLCRSPRARAAVLRLAAALLHGCLLLVWRSGPVHAVLCTHRMESDQEIELGTGDRRANREAGLLCLVLCFSFFCPEYSCPSFLFQLFLPDHLALSADRKIEDRKIWGKKIKSGEIADFFEMGAVHCSHFEWYLTRIHRWVLSSSRLRSRPSGRTPRVTIAKVKTSVPGSRCPPKARWSSARVMCA